MNLKKMYYNTKLAIANADTYPVVGRIKHDDLQLNSSEDADIDRRW